MDCPLFAIWTRNRILRLVHGWYNIHISSLGQSVFCDIAITTIKYSVNNSKTNFITTRISQKFPKPVPCLFTKLILRSYYLIFSLVCFKIPTAKCQKMVKKINRCPSTTFAQTSKPHERIDKTLNIEPGCREV